MPQRHRISRLVLVAAILIATHPTDAYANTAVPGVGFSFWLSAALFPVIVMIEWLVYARAGIARPLRLSGALNAISSIGGLLCSLPLLGVPIEMGIGLRHWSQKWTLPMQGTAITSLVTLAILLTLNFVTSVTFEYFVARRLRRDQLPPGLRAVVHANAYSYAFLLVILAPLIGELAGWAFPT
jgi:hypothetical protein